MRLSEFTRSSHAASQTRPNVARTTMHSRCTPTQPPRQPPASAELRRTLLQLPTRLAAQLCTPTRAARQPPHPRRATPYSTYSSFPHARVLDYPLPLVPCANRHARCPPCSLAVARKPVCDPRVSVKVLVVARIAAPHATRAKYTHHHCCYPASSTSDERDKFFLARPAAPAPVASADSPNR